MDSAWAQFEQDSATQPRSTEAIASVVTIEDGRAFVTQGAITQLGAGSGSATYTRQIKPFLDIVLGSILFLLTLPITAIAAAVIKLTMGGPVILRQERVGMYGEVFTLFKFRTMEPDRRGNQVAFVGEDRRKTHKHRSDPRITTVGRFLRKWSIDELPQFLNVIRGEMSLVGPRPEMVDIVLSYQPWQHERHSVRPGITGPWQVSERGGKLLHECTESDVEYVRNVSLRRDLLILLMTPVAALGLRTGF